MPQALAKDDLDLIYLRVADQIRTRFCQHRPREEMNETHCEAWLLTPSGSWSNEFRLKETERGPPERRLLLTLYGGCKYGSRCLKNLERKSHLNVIPPADYVDLKAFQQKAQVLLDDASLPFRAPCMFAEDKIIEAGYATLGVGR